MIFDPSGQLLYDFFKYEYNNTGLLSKKTSYIYGAHFGTNSFFTYYYNLQGQITKESYNDPNDELNFDIVYYYDNWGRLISTSSGRPNEVTLDAAYNYNEYGRLVNKQLFDNIGSSLINLETYYDYNIREQLNYQLCNRFGFRLKYDIQGNINNQYWYNGYYDVGALETKINNYSYFYDDMNRLIGGNYSQGSSTNPTGLPDIKNIKLESNDAELYNIYDVAYWYHKNGNFSKINRYHNRFDDLHEQWYTYYPNTNKIQAVVFGDLMGDIPVFYNYDLNGNLITDPHRSIQI